MARKTTLIYIVSVLIVFAFFEGLLGTQGIVVNNRLAAMVEKRQFERDGSLLRLEVLREQFENAYEKDAILDVAFKIGKTEPGQTVYFFSRIEEPIAQNTVSKTAQPLTRDAGFNGIGSGWLFLSASALVALCGLLLHALMKSKGKRHS